MVDKPCRTTHTVISPNRWHFSGKEDQSFLKRNYNHFNNENDI